MFYLVGLDFEVGLSGVLRSEDVFAVLLTFLNDMSFAFAISFFAIAKICYPVSLSAVQQRL